MAADEAKQPDPPRPDDWTRFSPPPKTRISDRYADPERRTRFMQAALLAVACSGLVFAMAHYAWNRTDAVRRQEAERARAEPSRVEERSKSAEEFLRERNMETAPFQRAQDERARRRSGGAGKE